MPLQIVRNDITKMNVDVIVNAANSSLLGGGGVDGQIHRAAGPTLLAECKTLGGCKVGEAKITGAGMLPCKYVIHTVGPRWFGGKRGERERLMSCYRASLALAKQKHCETIAFPLISSGSYGYPKDQALRVAVDTITEFLLTNDMNVYLVVFDKTSYLISEKLFSDIQSYIDDRYIDFDLLLEKQRRRLESVSTRFSNYDEEAMVDDLDNLPILPLDACAPVSIPLEEEASMERTAEPFANMPMPKMVGSLDEALRQIDESFSEMLLRKIDEAGMTDAQCYKKANIDRKLFSKIRSDTLYKPSKPTALAFAIALELSLDETKDLLMKAGFALSHSNKFDIIIEYFIQHHNYNIFEINEALFAFDQSLLGA